MIYRGLTAMTALSAGVLVLSLAWCAAVGMTMGVPPKPRVYVGYPLGETYHTPECQFIKTDDPEHPVLWFAGVDQIAASGRRPSPCCISEPPPQTRLRSPRFQPLSQAGNRLGQTQAD